MKGSKCVKINMYYSHVSLHLGFLVAGCFGADADCLAVCVNCLYRDVNSCCVWGRFISVEYGYVLGLGSSCVYNMFLEVLPNCKILLISAMQWYRSCTKSMIYLE